MKSLLHNLADRVLVGINVVIQNVEHPDPEELIKLVVWDSEVDNLERAVDDAILQIFATQQPLGYELRLVHACAKIASLLERMGDAVESLARQLASRQQNSHCEVIARMLADTKDLYCRSYAAMFEGDLTRIEEIRELDDKVDAWQQVLFDAAREILCAAPTKPDVENALQLITIGTKLEKLADLTCNWASQIDFAEHGNARRTLGKLKHRVVFLDDCSGLAAGLVASVLDDSARELVDISVITRSTGPAVSLLEITDLLTHHGVTPQVFPVARIEAINWNRTSILVTMGNFELTESERDFIPYKTVKVIWPECTCPPSVMAVMANRLPELAPVDFGAFLTQLKRRAEQLAKLIVRAEPSPS